MSAPAAAAAPIHQHHPAADSTVEFKGYAAYVAKGEVKPWSYNPPKLSDDFVELSIICCGICGSDVHMIDSGFGPSTYPAIPGHEIIGTVTAVGAGVKNLAIGDRVGVGAQIAACLNKKHDCAECGEGNQNHCAKGLMWAINSKYPDGQVAQGGFADRIRCDAHFAFKIPEAISSAEAAPLMCGGVTVFAPLQRYMTRPGMRVAVIGIGGLGHLGLMFASKLAGGTAEVTAVSHNSKKKDEALKMGATKFLDTSDKAALAAAFRTFDFVLCTANGKGQDYNAWLSTIRFGGTFCTVGLPEEPMQIAAFALIGAQIKVTASGIGSIQEMEQMLTFADKHNVRPVVQKLPMEKANEGIKSVRDGSVRFRVVLENPVAYSRSLFATATSMEPAGIALAPPSRAEFVSFVRVDSHIVCFQLFFVSSELQRRPSSRIRPAICIAIVSLQVCSRCMNLHCVGVRQACACAWTSGSRRHRELRLNKK